MTSTQVPTVDLAPGMPSRVVTISGTDITEGGQSMAGREVVFALSDTLDVTSGGDVIAKTSATVTLGEDGNGSIRLPVYDEDVRTWGGQEWAILVKGLGSQKAIRVPAGTSSIALAALPNIRPLRGRELQWAITGASVSITQGSGWNASISLSGGVLVLDLTVPPGAVSERRQVTELPADVLQWIGLDNAGTFAIPSTLTTETIANRPQDIGLAIVKIDPIATGGSLVTWSEYGGGQRVWQRTVSTSSARRTTWRRIDTPTRTVLHQLTQPGAPTLTDDEPQRHVRLPIRVPGTVNSWDLTLKNFNERSGTNFGDLNFVDVFIAPRAVDVNGNYTANFAEPPTNLGTPSPLGSVGSNGRRFVIENIGYTLEAGREYILSYAYYDPDASPNHLGIGGSYNGIEPGGVQSMNVDNAWSQYTPLDVYLKAEAPETTPTIAFVGSSSETGLHSSYPLRDSWAWRVAESRGAFPVLLGQSGQTLDGFASGFVWTKVGAMDRVDEAWLCAGSNDIYGGADLATVKGRYGVVADRMRAHLSDRIVGADVFPRATETAAVRTVRTAYNDWLRELPHGLSAVFDRAAAVSEGGVMRPDYDSGDGAHLNDTGQRVLAGTIINPSSTAHTHPISDVAGLAARLAALEYDTGWRDITSLAEIPVTSGQILLRRTGKDVKVRFIDLRLASGTGGTLVFLPSGFRPAMVEANTVRGVSLQAQLSAVGNLQIFYYEPGERIEGGLAATTDQAPPTSLPGDPA